MWLASSALAACFRIDPHRSQAAAKELLGEEFGGFVVSDRYTGYHWLDVLQQQLCWCHVIRQLVEISERQRTPGKLGNKLLKAAREVIATHRRYLQDDHDLDWLRTELRPLRERIQELLEQGARGRHQRTANFCAGLLEEYDALWTFCDVKDIEIPLTNNAAERVLRHAVRSSTAPSQSKATAVSSGSSPSAKPCAYKTGPCSTTSSGPRPPDTTASPHRHCSHPGPERHSRPARRPPRARSSQSMATSGRSRNTPCFCGSGRKLKHCCGRQLTPVRTWKNPTSGCRWRFWASHGKQGRYASEVAEHICNGERLWIARETATGTSWLIDQDPVTLLEVLDRLPGALYYWVIEQTMTALNDAAPEPGDDTREPTAEHDPHETFVLGEIHQLMLEVLRLAHASDALEAHLPINIRSTQRAELTLHDRAWQRLAS